MPPSSATRHGMSIASGRSVTCAGGDLRAGLFKPGLAQVWGSTGRRIKKALAANGDSPGTSALPTSSTRDVPARAAWLKPPPRRHTPHAHRVGRHGRRVGLLAHFGRPWDPQRFHNVGEVEANDTTGRRQGRDSACAGPTNDRPRPESQAFSELPGIQQVFHGIHLVVWGGAQMVYSLRSGPSPHSLCLIGIIGHSSSILLHRPWACPGPLSPHFDGALQRSVPHHPPSSRGHRPQAGIGRVAPVRRRGGM